MQKEFISARQASCILIMYIFGSTLVVGMGAEAGQDAWISLLVTILMTIPAVLVYARIMRLFPEKDLFDIMEALFGKIFGKTLIALFSFYAIQLSSAVLRNFTDFIQLVSMPETPQLPVAVVIILVVLYLIKSGNATFGKWSVVTVAIIFFIILFTSLVALKSMDFANILPIMEHSFGEILSASYKQFALPFAETVLLLGMADSLKKEESPYKAYLYGILIAGLLSLVILLRNIEVLGSAMTESVYFPSFVAARIINVGDFFPRIESMISMNYLFAGVTKITLCLFVASKGIGKLFNMQGYREILAPACLMSLALSVTSYESMMHLFDFVRTYYPIYAAPFQVIIPLLIWIAAEIRTRRKKPAA